MDNYIFLCFFLFWSGLLCYNLHNKIDLCIQFYFDKFDKYIQSCKYHQPSKNNVFLTPQNFLLPFAFGPHLQPLVHSIHCPNVCSNSLVFPRMLSKWNCIIYTLCVRILRFTHVYACVIRSLLLLTEQYFVTLMYHHLFAHLPVAGI